MNLGISGELRCVVTKADGTVKKDTGFNKNLILNSGLDFFGGSIGSSFMLGCVIGTGVSQPVPTQTKLDTPIAMEVSQGAAQKSRGFVDDGSGLWKFSDTKTYRFTGLNNVNVTELGLVSSGSLANHNLVTRALIRDSEGEATSITVQADETLDIYYRVHKVVDIRDKSFVVNLIDGVGVETPYNVTIRPTAIGSAKWDVDAPFINPSNGISYPLTTDLVANTAYPSGGTQAREKSAFAPYVAGSYKRLLRTNYDLDTANIAIRSIYIMGLGAFPFQVRFGRVSDDAPLTKTNKDTLYIPIEFSWGRYEGEL